MVSDQSAAESVEQGKDEKIVTLDFMQLQEWVPHRFPFLLIDRITAMVPNNYVVALKNITGNEECFVGHFPGKPVYPGVLLLEAMAQAAAVLARYSESEEASGKLFYLVGADNVKWKKQVLPGDQLRIEMRSFKKRLPLWVMQGEITVGDKLVCSATLSAAAA